MINRTLQFSLFFAFNTGSYCTSHSACAWRQHYLPVYTGNFLTNNSSSELQTYTCFIFKLAVCCIQNHRNCFVIDVLLFKESCDAINFSYHHVAQYATEQNNTDKQCAGKKPCFIFFLTFFLLKHVQYICFHKKKIVSVWQNRNAK